MKQCLVYLNGSNVLFVKREVEQYWVLGASGSLLVPVGRLFMLIGVIEGLLMFSGCALDAHGTYWVLVLLVLNIGTYWCLF